MNSSRVENLREKLTEGGIDSLFVSSPANIFYLSGLSQFIHPGDAYILVCMKKSYLFTSELYAGGVGEMQNTELRITHAGNSLIDQMNDIVRHERVEKVGFESQHVSYSLFSHLQKLLAAGFVSTQGIIETIRMEKDAGEVRSIQLASALTDKTFRHILQNIAHGTTERALAFEIELFIRKNGGQLAFPVIAAFGAHAATPHHENGDKRLEKKDGIILLDFGARVDGYCADLTRCIFVDTPSDVVSSTYGSLLEIQTETVAFAQAQKMSTKLSTIAAFCDRRLAAESLPPLPHSLGHGLGIDIHEAPRVHPQSEDVLDEGVIFTIEPGVYVPGKVGMRIEDTVGVVKNNLKQFTNSPKDQVVISI